MPPQTSTPLPQLIYPRIIKLRERINKLVYANKGPLPVSIGPIHEAHFPLEQAQCESFHPILPGYVFSPAKAGEHGEFPWTHRWFKVVIPAASSNGENNYSRFLHFVANGEFTVYYDNEPWSGIDPCHPRCDLPDCEEAVTLWIDGGQWQTGFWFGLEAPDEHGFRLFKCDLEVRDSVAFETYHDLSMLIEWVEHEYKKEGIAKNTENGFYQPLDTVDPRLRRMLKRLNDACDVFDREGLVGVEPALKTIYTDFPADPTAMTVSYVGHAHIDLVWLWPERVTYRKAIHSYATQLRLMERYPEMTFTMSQPPLFYHIADREPIQAEKISERIRGGRWEFTGVLEVEADTQIPCGEGLARSLIYGQERIKAVRGKAATTVWIPDVFGYSQCLPQLFSLAGVENFYTTKILWSTITKFPHNSFLWKSPDGSEVLTHLAVAGYNCHIKIEEAHNAQRSYKQADVHNELLCASGYGDGGGGLTEDHCERARRMRNLSGTPRSGWSTVEAFFERMNGMRDELPRYRGELFLEYHRGVHTTQSDFKARLRSCERSLQIREACRVLNGGDALGPEAWLRVLFAHFHDATPGSSINSVYKELNAELKTIADNHNTAAQLEWPSGGASFVVVNPIAWRRWNTVELPRMVKHLTGADGKAYDTQEYDGKALAVLALEGICAQVFVPSEEPTECEEPLEKVAEAIHATPTQLDNGVLRAEFDAMSGQLTSLFVDGRELAIEKAGGTFTLHQDNPAAFDAWDMDHHVVWMKDVLAEPMNLRVKASGPVVAVLQGQCRVGKESSMVVRYILEAQSESLRVECDVDWQETNTTLRYEVQTGYRGEFGRFGAPFGSVDRSQTEGGPKEEAQWEVSGSRWASVIDGRNRGISIVTEAKYGFRIKDGCLGVTLLRSPTFPDPVADKGRHCIRFALAPHRDESNLGGRSSTAAKSDELFTPAIVLENARPAVAPITFGGLESVVPSWIMPSRKGNGFLVRLHEVAGAQSDLRFKLAEEAKFVHSVDLNEDILEELLRDGDGYSLAVPAYKILTIKVER